MSEIYRRDIVIIGGGPAGLSAALSAKETGADSILIIERDKELGGILNQCIHNGFGLHTFKEELTGPEYAARFIERVSAEEIPYMLNTMVVDIAVMENGDKCITAMNKEQGLFEIQAKAVILAMGCRERPRGALNTPGYRPAGIFSAGTAQHYVNIEGRMPGKEVVILGSGDIGLIMARRMTLEGAKVKVVAEIMPYSGGLKRNIAQCLGDFDIPLKLSHTVVDIAGKERVESVTIAKVDENRKPIPGTEEVIPCDTLLLSCGLIPENELSTGLGVILNPVTSGPFVNESFETNVPGVFACGNVLHVHDLVDYVSEEAGMAGTHAAEYVKMLEGRDISCADVNCTEEDMCLDTATAAINLIATSGVRYTVPMTIRPDKMADSQLVRFRVGDVYKNVYLNVYFNDTPVMSIRKQVMAPGEMEQIRLSKAKVMEYPDLREITFKIEKAPVKIASADIKDNKDTSKKEVH